MQIKACLNSLELNLRLVGLKLGHFIYALFSYVFVFEIKKKRFVFITLHGFLMATGSLITRLQKSIFFSFKFLMA